VDGIRIHPKMPEGWHPRFKQEKRILERDMLVLEGRREKADFEIPIVLTNRTGRPIDGLKMKAEVVGRGWVAGAEIPEDLQVGVGERARISIKVAPDRREPLFRAPIWRTRGGRQIADWLEENVFSNKFRALFIISGFILAATFLKSAVGYSKGYWSNFLTRRALMDIRRELFDSIISQSIAYFDRRKSGHIISRFTNSLNQMTKGITAILSEIVLEPLILFGSLALAFSINPRLAVIGLLIFPLNYLLIRFTGRWIRRSTDRGLKERANMVATLQKSIEGIRIVKAFVMEAQERERFESANVEAFRHDMRGARAKSLVQPVVEIFSAAFIVVFLLLGGMSVLRGDMSPGDFVVFYAAMVACYSPIKKINNAVGEIQESVSGAVDVFAEIDHVPDLRQAEGAMELPPLKEALSFRGVQFRYDSSAPVLRGIDLTIRKGEFVAVVGPSGAGKSTLVSLLPRFYDATGGSIEIDGVDIRTVTLDSLRGQIGFVTQEPILFHDTIANNIAFGNRDGKPEEIEAAARTAHAHEFIQDLPEGYATVVGDRGVMLSGGQRQRIALARAVMRNPEVLILDEPTSSLDSESERLIQEAMETFVRGRTTIVIAHRLSTVLKADRILVMDQGRIVQEGTHEQLLADGGGLYRRLYEVQFRDVPEGSVRPFARGAGA
jgi:subfamily B ATP-binding cassette protein MsbA